MKATVVNKFRGDAAILEPGLDQLRALMGVPVAGVVPYASLDIDDEDSLSERFCSKDARAVIDIAVVRLPRVSNATDFAALDAVEGVGVRFVSRPRDLGEPDLIVLPGTKNTIDDLCWLRENYPLFVARNVGFHLNRYRESHRRIARKRTDRSGTCHQGSCGCVKVEIAELCCR